MKVLFGSRLADVVVGVGIAALVVVEAISPGTPAQAIGPRDTFAHVEVIVTSKGITTKPASVPSGVIEVNVVDQRGDQSVPLAIKSDVGWLRSGSQLVTMRVLGDHALDANGIRGRFTVVVPTLPNQQARTLTLELRADGFAARGRALRREEPYVPGTTHPDDAQAWTTIPAGSNTIEVRNRTHAQQTCGVAGTGVHAMPPGGRITLEVSVASAPRASLTCIAGMAEQRLDLLVAG
ncbi:MAG TPA: hypothetical protein VFR41_12390 [Acidimicrobiia bacterium]|nr:hypothetical protein [Acidimicrobiia bacterium]